MWARNAGSAASTTCSRREASSASSRVDRNEATRSWGRFRMKPTVSETRIRGCVSGCNARTVVSRVAKSRLATSTSLTMSEVLVANRLFATLDTTVRALHPETQPRILVSDTVGFIRNLPHDLVASFRSTLDEALDASLLLHVVDAADPAFRSHIQVTTEVLEDIGAGKLSSLVILNKIDIVGSSQKALLEKEFPQAIAMSALNPQDIEALRSRLVTFFLDTMTEVELVVPYGKEGVLADIRKSIHVLSESYGQKGVCLKIKANPGTLTALKQRVG